MPASGDPDNACASILQQLGEFPSPDRRHILLDVTHRDSFPRGNAGLPRSAVLAVPGKL